MNRLTLFTICLLAGTAATGFCQDQPLTDASEPQQAPSQAETNQPAKSESAGLAETLFKGEWKLNSTKLICEGIQVGFADGYYPKPKSGWIKDGALHIDGEIGKYEVVTVGESEATIRPISIARLADPIEINRTTYLLFLTVPLRQREARKPPRSHVKGQIDMALLVEPRQPDEIVMEFWRVDPNRRAVVERMELLSNLITELEISGDATELAEAWQQLKEITALLERMDTAPEIASMKNKILLARKSGKHTLAAQWEKSLIQDYAEAAGETKSASSDSSAQQDLLKQINAAKLELDQFKHVLGANHPEVIEARRKLASLQSLFNQNATNSPAPQRPTNSRAQLEQTRDQLLIKYAEAEQRARSIAIAEKQADDKEPILSDKTAMNHQQLTQAVRTAFDLQQQLQDVRLQLAELDLQELRSKQERRTALADKVIERRVNQLLQDNSASTATQKNTSRSK